MDATTNDRGIMAEWIADLSETPDGEFPSIQSRVTTSTLGELVASRVGGEIDWSGSSEAVYVTVGDHTMRIACHASGGIGSMAGGHDAPRWDVRIGNKHDETSTDLIGEPMDVCDMVSTADSLAAKFSD